MDGQKWINKILGATPDNPIQLPVKNIPVKIELTPDDRLTFLGIAGLLALGGIVIASIIKK